MNQPELKLNDKLPFGRSKGERVDAVINESASYIIWLADNTDLIFSTAAITRAKEHMQDDVEYKAYLKTKKFPTQYPGYGESFSGGSEGHWAGDNQYWGVD